ncbi:(6-4)DNA photolyase isoform X1 [Cryptomeria japonica]|uniref:(6-4)DNA photolyase isoform X1 n=1 Tax=Cryptomeria japonica TaxID=3369 RepID=UPI0025ABBDCA|nr:(6-4)DNA photolyase isoform X1 [Cryptomeria japonica]
MLNSALLRPTIAYKLPWLLHTCGHSGFAKQRPMEGNTLIWFRKGLRIHDNPALEYACQNAKNVYPVFVLDPWFLEPDPSAPSLGSTRVGINRIRFLLECLDDLDGNLKRRGSRLLLFKGNPTDVIPQLLEQWSIQKLCFEFDIEPYAQKRDNCVKEYASKLGVDVFCPVSHTIFSPEEIIKKNGGKPPLTYQSFIKLISGAPHPLGDGPSSLPPIDIDDSKALTLPTLTTLGFKDISQEDFTPFHGGETEALRRLNESLHDKKWVAEFEKPKGDPTAFLKPATTVLSPYLKFGCLSSRLFYQRLQEVYGKVKNHTRPPVSLEGQLLWREFFYTVAYGTPNFEHMKGNPICKQIPWNDDDHLLATWRDAQTGYPWIDAVMVQLRKWGWMHHLARHAVACFLTRGDLFVHWEKGRDVFDRLLIDSDWAINNSNWMWLSCSAFFSQYYRIYSPISFGKKYDPNGEYIRHFLPVLKDMPKEYIYEPWSAPLEVQRKAKCIIGRDYPEPVVAHVEASKNCKKRIATAYAKSKSIDGKLNHVESLYMKQSSVRENDDANKRSSKKQRQKKLTDY